MKLFSPDRIKKLLFVNLLLLIGGQLYSQSSHNLEKYWVYRERVKNFLVSGDCQGCTIPADIRKTKFNEWNDSPWDLGFWIGTLAIEYHLLQQHGFSTSQTEKDLFYAIEAINRLDKMAEIAYGCNNNISAYNNRNRFR